jgi:F0F1-type ATP synthase membrane subunit b/b'
VAPGTFADAMTDTSQERPPLVSEELREQAQQAGQRLEAWSRRTGRLVAEAAARAREEAEDILAEAQSIRRGERA